MTTLKTSSTSAIYFENIVLSFLPTLVYLNGHSWSGSEPIRSSFRDINESLSKPLGVSYKISKIQSQHKSMQWKSFIETCLQFFLRNCQRFRQTLIHISKTNNRISLKFWIMLSNKIKLLQNIKNWPFWSQPKFKSFCRMLSLKLCSLKS